MSLISVPGKPIRLWTTRISVSPTTFSSEWVLIKSSGSYTAPPNAFSTGMTPKFAFPEAMASKASLKKWQARTFTSSLKKRLVANSEKAPLSPWNATTVSLPSKGEERSTEASLIDSGMMRGVFSSVFPMTGHKASISLMSFSNC